MSDIIATVTTNSDLTSAVISADNPVVSAVGIQGPSGASTTLESISNVDATSAEDGSILIYKTTTNKWTSTTHLDGQNMEGGEF
jgi:hypothetical protein